MSYNSSREAASESRNSDVRGWSWRSEAGKSSVTGPVSARLIAVALPLPCAISSRCRASKIVARPCVIAWVGTSSRAAKNLALSCRVRSASLTTRVRDENAAPGSLKPMWPFEPMPRICRSIPPAEPIAASYASPDRCSSRGFPSGTWTRRASIPRAQRRGGQ